MKKFWECKQSANQNEADVFIFGEIVSFKWEDTDTTAASFQKDLKELGEVSQINLHINSPGGSVFEGIAIGNMLRQHKARVVAHVDALAASIASVIVASCDEVIMPENSMLMIHNPWTISMGNAKELRKQADDLDKIAESSVVTYLAKAGEKLTEEKIKQIMDEETWMSAQEAYNYGLCDVVESANQVAASISQKLFETYQKVPEKLLDSRQEDSRDQEKIEKIVEHAKQNKALIGTILGGL
ncbi:Clp protease ClpP [Enterococcus faecium]|uniref:head maturation protease, ClpP-related n=1 Tax=Enterococcus faecium TaxID=1352 RepID=UPI000DE8F172|nr:head maturation protease, ClpP-related [Enterococcus faecium]EGP5078372.1 Clp protease ClpP [Enterococcus faecium]EGP5179212.1 Clp protease ClpP [Enterococcus faecium]EGP5700136.1 Clp protease ClpP [Enterococcus faecium]EGW2153413.1 Clp protease ClpP [Enterococcus faecium]RBT26129.1 ATP-dependent Clp endopeptidase, proteolytic subunit ClpP [Enterococcus faecium]